MSVPPHDLDAEAAVLSACLNSSDVTDELASVLREDDFYSPANRKIWNAMRALSSAGEPTDAVMVGHHLKTTGDFFAVGGVAYLGRITDAAPAVVNVGSYARIVTRLARVRATIRACQEIAAEGYEGNLDADKYIERAEATISAIVRDGGADEGPKAIRDVVRATFVDMQNRAKGLVHPVRTGFYDLDNLLISETGEVSIVAARPGMGKTSFVMDVVKNAAGGSSPCGSVVFSLEMKDVPLVKRAVASLAGVPLSDMRRGSLSQGQWDELTRAATRLSEMPIRIDSAPGISVLGLRSRFRRARADLDRSHPGVPVRLVVVDYLQLMSPNPRSKAGNREQEVSEISRGLAEFSLEEDVLVVAVSQLNRSVESRGDKRPCMADLRESGAIEQDATSIVFLYRDEVYNPGSADRGKCEAIVAKSRNGDVARVLLGFDGRYTRFSNLAR